MKGFTYAKTIAKIQASAIFHIRDIRRFVWIRHAGAHPDGHEHGGRKSIEISVTEFCNESENLSLEELINIKPILFVTHELFR